MMRTGTRLQRPERDCDIGVSVRDAVKRFGRVGAANGVTFELARGELMALLGPSGCGKTTTLRLIAGFEWLDAGEIEIGGKLAAGPDLHAPPEQRRIGMVFQEYALFPHLNVIDNVRFGLHNYAGDRERRVATVLEMVGLGGMERRHPHELSGGQQQRVALARALAPEPAVVLLDEPFSNLDAGLRVRVRAEVRSILRQAGATAIFVTHDQEEALSLVDRVAVLIDGVVRQVAAPQQALPPARTRMSLLSLATPTLPGTASGHAVECELGALELVSERRGEVEVLLRPENVSVMPAGADAGARVRAVLFFGHDQLVSIQLPSGRSLTHGWVRCIILRSGSLCRSRRLGLSWLMRIVHEALQRATGRRIHRHPSKLIPRRALCVLRSAMIISGYR